MRGTCTELPSRLTPHDGLPMWVFTILIINSSRSSCSDFHPMKLIVFSGQILADIQKELNLIKLKTTQLVEKQSSFRKMLQDYDELNKQVKSDHRSYLSTHKELTTISHTIEYIKYVCTITPWYYRLLYLVV